MTRFLGRAFLGFLSLAWLAVIVIMTLFAFKLTLVLTAPRWVAYCVAVLAFCFFSFMGGFFVAFVRSWRGAKEQQDYIRRRMRYDR